MSGLVTSRRVCRMAREVMSRHVTSIMSRHVTTSCHVTHVESRHVSSCHVTSCPVAVCLLVKRRLARVVRVPCGPRALAYLTPRRRYKGALRVFRLVSCRSSMVETSATGSAGYYLVSNPTFSYSKTQYSRPSRYHTPTLAAL